MKAGQTPATRTLVEHLLGKTASLKLGNGAEPQEPVPAVHGVILDHLLCNKQMHKVLEALVGTTVANVEAFLIQRSSKSRAAGEILWKHHIRQGRHAEASEVLLQLAEQPDKDTGLRERTHFLDLALQAAGQAQPQTKALVDKLRAQLDAAARVQVPLLHELQLVAKDERLAPRWREAAEQRLGALGRLLGLQALYEIAVEFGLFHVVLVIADISSNVQEREHVASAWVSMFFPPAASPYSPPEMAGREEVQRQHGLFPLLMVRRSAAFLLQDEQMAPSPMAPSARLEDLRLRASRLLTELGAATQSPSSVWDAHCIGVLLEYCNCLWHCSFELDEERGPVGSDTAPTTSGLTAVDATGPSTSRPPQAAEAVSATVHVPGGERAWIALRVMTRRPFHFTHLSVLRFYAGMLAELPTWLRDLQALLPPDPARRRPALSEDVLRTHLGEVALIVLDSWVLQLEDAKPGDRGVAEFCSALPAVEGALGNVRSHLEVVQGKAQASVAKRLLRDADRLEAAGRRIHGRALPSGTSAMASLGAGALAAPAKLGD